MERDAPRVIILAAGRGTRMRAERPGTRLDAAQRRMADRGLKPLIPFNGEPFLSYVLTEIADAGYREVCLVVGPGEDPVREMYENIATRRLALSVAVQERPEGGAHALLTAEPFAGGGAVVVLNADDLYPHGALERLRDFGGGASDDGGSGGTGIGASALVGFQPDALVDRGNVPAERIDQYALLTADTDGFLAEIVEKPTPEERRRLSEHVWVSKTCWLFRPVIFDACRNVGRSARGEYELPDAVALARRESGERFRVLPSEEAVLDLSNREDVATMTERLRGRAVCL